MNNLIAQWLNAVYLISKGRGFDSPFKINPISLDLINFFGNKRTFLTRVSKFGSINGRGNIFTVSTI
ncbi:hypothetical protein BpHYR1_007263 [Brachionus plicatilis]|uniref:Uncharacterized protein n=1 Tax=Brachionus plicatilis TaxID=10195 RepID=A0A3M7T6T2_BRAPC|nr:hypothetical protein BpHYR1_007263 [Brachionus plicatilis]